LINKIAKLALKAGQTQGVHMIDAAIVRHIVSRFRRGGKGLLPERRGRTRAAAVKPLSSETSGTNLFLPFPQAIISGGLQGEQAAIADMLKFPEYIYSRRKVYLQKRA
jgi:hypothetical protein